MRRFYIEDTSLEGECIGLPAQLAHRMAKVLRLRAGDRVALFNGDGNDVEARLEPISDRAAVATVVARRPGPPEPRVRVHLYQSITKGERFEWLVEKATELGVHRVVPLIAARAVVRPDAKGNRHDRWRRIAIEAAEQCGRSAVSIIDVPQPFGDAVASAPGIRIVPYEAAGLNAENIQSALSSRIDELFAREEVSVFIGPEGGFEADEISRAGAAGAQVVTMGERILRSETAGLTALTLVMHAVGELG